MPHRVDQGKAVSSRIGRVTGTLKGVVLLLRVPVCGVVLKPIALFAVTPKSTPLARSSDVQLKSSGVG